MYTIPPVPNDGMAKFKPSDCFKGAVVLDSVMGFSGILVCSSCRKPIVVNLIDSEWVHQ